MEKIILRKQGMGFVPVNQPAREFFDKTYVGQEITVKANRDRNLGHHRKAFALLHVIFNSQEEYDNETKLRKALTARAGYFEVIEVKPDGSVLMEADSWDFNSMPQEKFNKMYEDIKTEALKLLPSGWTDEQLDNAVREIISF